MQIPPRFEAITRIPLRARKPVAQGLMWFAGVVAPEMVNNNTLDDETGLLNKRGFRDEFYKRIRSGSNSGNGYLVFFDGDGFGKVNKNLGHLVGDDVIRDFAERIQHGMRSDDLLGRFGGDEFIAFCDNIPSPDVLSRRLAEINDKLRDDYEGLLSLSIGAAAVVNGSFSQTVARADEAQRHVKARDGNGVEIYSSSSPVQGNVHYLRPEAG